jgi:hypothetical protein
MTVERAVPIRSTIPARLDRLRWSPFHTRLRASPSRPVPKPLNVTSKLSLRRSADG